MAKETTLLVMFLFNKEQWSVLRRVAGMGANCPDVEDCAEITDAEKVACAKYLEERVAEDLSEAYNQGA
jgi:hypothetical protein